MSEVSELTDLSEVSGPGPHLAQVDPPHPFRSALKTLVIAAIVVTIALGLYVYLGQKPPVAAGEILTSTSIQCIRLSTMGPAALMEWQAPASLTIKC